MLITVNGLSYYNEKMIKLAFILIITYFQKFNIDEMFLPLKLTIYLLQANIQKP